MTTLHEALAAVEAATGPAQYIDAMVERAASGNCTAWGGQCIPFSGSPIPYAPHAYTASVDAALALMERVLPGCGLSVKFGADRTHAFVRHPSPADITPPPETAVCPSSTHPTPALALCAAILKALIAEQESAKEAQSDDQ